MTFTVALAGNPNCGKTTLFNKLTGSSQRVGNWPGVTIDKKVGKIKETNYDLVDIPGIYSLSPYSPEEVISRDFIVEERPDALINIVDATNLERNLFLTLQLLDCNIPTVIALNMMDEVKKKGDSIDIEELTKLLNCPVVPISALRGEGMTELIRALTHTMSSKKTPEPIYMDYEVEKTVSRVEKSIKGKVPDESIRWHAIKLLEKDHIVEKDHLDAKDVVQKEIADFEKSFDDESDSIIANARYEKIEEIVEKAVKRAHTDLDSLSDRIDNIVTHKYYSLPIFLAIIALVYFISVSTVGAWGTEWLGGLFSEIASNVSSWCIEHNVSPILSGLLVDGIIGGVGAVLVFVPQMFVLFLLMCILEDVGYMSRIAFVLDRVFRYFGLSGKSFIPILVGTGCGVPGIMSSRTIESERDRKITAMTVTFMPCGAKLPVIALIASALFGGNWLIGLFCYFLGIVCVLMSGIILKKWRSLAGDPAPFIMELPPYHRPAWDNIFKTTFDRTWSFIKRAGTIILLACVLVWFLSSFNTSLVFIGSGSQEGSILQYIGQSVCILFAPIGWGSWELTVATITGLITKENIIGSIEIMAPSGIESIVGPAAGLSFLVFNLICAPCFAAIGSMRMELGNWRITALAVAYQCLLAYAVSSIAFTVCSIITGGAMSTLTMATCAISVFALLYLIIAKDPFLQKRRPEE